MHAQFPALLPRSAHALIHAPFAQASFSALQLNKGWALDAARAKSNILYYQGLAQHEGIQVRDGADVTWAQHIPVGQFSSRLECVQLYSIVRVSIRLAAPLPSSVHFGLIVHAYAAPP